MHVFVRQKPVSIPFLGTYLCSVGTEPALPACDYDLHHDQVTTTRRKSADGNHAGQTVSRPISPQMNKVKQNGGLLDSNVLCSLFAFVT